MPTFTYVCAAAHETDRFFAAGQARTKTTPCGQCKRRASFSISATFGGKCNITVNPDVPEHYSPSIGGVVKSRRHIRELESRSRDTANPFHRYEPIKPKPADFKERMARRQQEGQSPAPRHGGWGERERRSDHG